MTRRMSVALTLDAVRAETKTVTRRDPATWRNLKVGDELDLIEKGMGLPAGAQQVRVRRVEIVAVNVEPLDDIAREPDGTAREGLPHMTPMSFIEFWEASHPGAAFSPLFGRLCRRIEWRYIGRWSPPEPVLGFDRRGPAEGVTQRYEEIAA